MKRISFYSLLTLLAMATSLSTFADDSESVKRGEKLFKTKGCKACHVIGNLTKKVISGPDLYNVTNRRSKEWLKGWIKDPRVYMANKDPIIVELMAKYPTKMPYLNLKDEQVTDIIEYLAHETEEFKKKNPNYKE